MKRSAMLLVTLAALLGPAAPAARAQVYQSLAHVVFTWYSPAQGGYVSNGFTALLYDHLAPGTVNNFLHYADAEAYTYNVVDALRTAGPGGSSYFSSGDYWVSTGGSGLVSFPVQTTTPIASELAGSSLSNTRGTLASFEVMGQPAATVTSRWLVNLSDANAAAFDALGYTPFGEVMTPGMLLPYSADPKPRSVAGAQWLAETTLGGGMALVDAVAGLPVYEFNASFVPQIGGGNFLPVVNYTQANYNAAKKLTLQNLLFTSVFAVDGKTPQKGDLDFNGALAVSDALSFDAELTANAADRLWQADLNDDGVIDNTDRWLLVDRIGTTVWGDVNLNGEIAADDFNPFMLVYGGSKDYLFSADLNRDGAVDDLDHLLFFTDFGHLAPPKHDLNNDGVIDLQDLNLYNTWAFQSGVDYHFQLDLNHDGVLDAAERGQFTSLCSDLLSPYPDPPFVTPGGGGAIIPEPASAGLLAAGLAMLLRRPRKTAFQSAPRAARRLPQRAGLLAAAILALLLAPAAFAGVGRNIVHVDYVWYSPAHQGYVSARMNFLLYNDIAPNTVANFNQYVTQGLYDWTVVHRSAVLPDGFSPFVLQGGGFTVELDGQNRTMGVPITTFGNINSEWDPARMSNTRGTLSMARVSNDENSASSQWFINMSDENTFLDYADNPAITGFTVFGKVIDANTFGSNPPGGGMDLADAIAALPVFDLSIVPSHFSGAFTHTPMVNYNQQMYQQGDWPTFGNFLWVVMSLDTDVLVGDVSGDGLVNTEDINPFIAALTTPGYEIRADINQDGLVNTEDINPFISLLTAVPPAGAAAVIPEPASAATLLLASAALLRRRR